MTVRGTLYDAMMLPLTATWYRAVLERLPNGARVLDVGIGTAGALTRNADAVRAANLRITGLDIDADYVRRAQRTVWRHDLATHVDVRLESVYDHADGPYDAVYFSASFMLLPDPVRALEHVGGLLAHDGHVYFTQTFQDRRSRVMERVKPMLRRVTCIDFGRVTYEEDFRLAARQGGIDLSEMTVMRRKGARSYRLAVGQRHDA